LIRFIRPTVPEPEAPVCDPRRLVREAGGGFVLVHVATPIEVCEARDRKGLYAKARVGLVAGFTDLSDPYEEPEDAEIRVDTSHLSIEAATDVVWNYLEREGWVSVGE
jgi:sulfate adenylyltransferase